MDEYGSILRGQDAVRFGTRDLDMPEGEFAAAKTDGSGSARLCLTRVKDFHREYQWVS
jgi:polyketide biosynthesis 3-hydroxy-3-methylglutaryl-CoA synthase-like enzyme PksG